MSTSFLEGTGRILLLLLGVQDIKITAAYNSLDLVLYTIA